MTPLQLHTEKQEWRRRRQPCWRPPPWGSASLLLPRRFACATVAGGRRQPLWRRPIGWLRQPLWRSKKDHFWDKFFQGSICEISFLKGPKCEKSSADERAGSRARDFDGRRGKLGFVKRRRHGLIPSDQCGDFGSMTWISSGGFPLRRSKNKWLGFHLG